MQHLAEKASAYGLVDAILCPQVLQANLREAKLQVWTLTVLEDRTAKLVCDDGDDTVIDSHELAWTDFPLQSIILWFAVNTRDLSGEH